MNRNIILGFAGGLVFAISLLIGLIVTDNATDQGGGEPRLPGALGEPIEIISGIPISDPDAPVGFPIEPSQAAYVPIDTGGGSGGGGSSGDAGGGGAPAGGGGSPSDGDTGTRDTGDDATELTVAPLAPEDATELTVAPLAPEDADFRFDDFFIGDLFFEFLDYPLFRFLDLCADDGTLPGCPFGVGGTVLFPLDDPSSLGDFRLGSALRNASATGGACDIADEDDHQFFVSASHPATFDITYYPPSRPSDPTTVTVSNTDEEHPEYVRFTEDAVEHRLATSAWPRECFLLTELPVGGEPYQHYIVEVEARSFITGSTASETYTVDITAGRRPPVVFVPDDGYDVGYDIRAIIPIKSESQRAAMTLIHQGDIYRRARGETTTTCAEAEAEGRIGEPIPSEAYGTGRLTDRGWRRDAYSEASPSWPYDRAYDWQQIIDATGLNEGSTYLVCIWWIEAPSRFDTGVIVEREMRWITTPNIVTGVIRLSTVQNPSSFTISADSYTLSFSCGSDARFVTLPHVDLVAEAEADVPGRPVLCNPGGGPFPDPTIGSWVRVDGPRGEFGLVLDPNPPLGQRITVDLGRGRVSPGWPILILTALYTEGSDSGGDRWQTGVGEVFEPPPEVPEALPDEIQIDTDTSGVEPAGRNGIRVTAEFDRPVRLRGELLGEDCLTGPEPSFDSNVFSPGLFEQTHSFFLNGLCFLTRYSVLLEVEDEAGNTASFADVTVPPYFRGARYFAGTGWTDGYHVEYTVRSLGGTGTAHVSRFDVTIDGLTDGVTIDLRNPEQCFGRIPERPTASGTMVVGNELFVTINTVISSEYQSDGPCGSSRRGRDIPYRASVTATIPIEDFEAGEWLMPIPIRNPWTESGGPWRDTGIGISLRITG